MTSHERRVAWENNVLRNVAAGRTIENHPAFLALVDRWIEGEITLGELRQGYSDFLRQPRRQMMASPLSKTVVMPKVSEVQGDAERQAASRVQGGEDERLAPVSIDAGRPTIELKEQEVVEELDGLLVQLSWSHDEDDRPAQF